MPSVPLERIPLPSLQTYTAVSILLFSCSLYYALQVTSDPNWIIHTTDHDSRTSSKMEEHGVDNSRLLLHKFVINHVRPKRFSEITYVMIEEPLCVWVLINMAYCVMVLLGRALQKIVFGDLRVIERQHMRDKFWNFLFYKFIFIFGVMNVQNMDEVVMWCGWFSGVGAFHLLSTLCKDRFEYLSFSPTTPKWTHLRLLSLMFLILATCATLCTLVALHAPFNLFLFMVAEWMLVVIRTVYVLTRYLIHMYDGSREGIWEKRGFYTYYSELLSDLATLAVDFLHHLHMLVWRNIFLSVASLVICMQLRCFINEIQRKIGRHKNYLRVSRHMENNFPLATKADIETYADDCAICWDRMESARKLPCGHMFHTSCLHSWLEQVTNCPTCRTSLVPKQNPNRNSHGEDPRQQTTNHFFHFDGSRYISWLPSFSVEVSHTSLLLERPRLLPTMPSHTDSMARQIQQLLPHVPYQVIFQDLLMTNSVELTIDNILENQVDTQHSSPTTPPPLAFPRQDLFPLFHTAAMLAEGNSRGVTTPHSSPHPAPLSGPSSHSLRGVESREGGSESSDSGVSENTVRSTEESAVIIVSGGGGCRFSKNSRERQHMLCNRKEELIRKARNKYISRIISTGQSPGSPNSRNE